MTSLYVSSGSLLHRLPASLKLLLLCAAGIGLFAVADWRLMLGALGVSLLLYPLAKIPPRLLWQQLKALYWLILLLALVQWWALGWAAAVAAAARLLTLLLAANLLTLTTRTTALVDTLTWLCGGLRFVGLRPERVGLALSLALRFLPVIIEVTHDVRDAQRSRGLEFSVMATAIPTIVRTLKMADDIADAIEARQG